MNRKKWLKAIALLFLIGSISALLIFKATTPLFPSLTSPIVFYANQTGQDLKLLFCQAISQTKHTLFASFYGITDKDIIALLSKQARLGIDTTIAYDARASLPISTLLPYSQAIAPRKCKGLMHRKILITDQENVFLGSANWTHSSLRHHSNCIIGVHSASLAAFLSHPYSSVFSCTLAKQTIECYLLPNRDMLPLHRLLALIDSAGQSIRVAMFTLTHSQIVDALIRAASRGVTVSVIVDSYSGRGASKKMVERLQSQKIPVALSQGQQLLHHKWAIVDEKIFAMGSANWTKAAFTNNEDFIFILFPLTQEQKKALKDLWQILEVEAIQML